MIRRPTALITALLTGALLAGGLLAAPAAHADSPQQQAARLASQVATLRAQAEAATEAYDDAEGRLAEVVTQTFAAKQAVTEAVQAAQAHAQQSSATLRQLYEIGGPTALYVGVLSRGQNPAQIGGQLQAVSRVLAANNATGAALDARSAAAMAAQRAADDLAQQQTQLERQVATKAAAVQAALAKTQSLLAAANAQVLALEQAAEAQQAAEQQAEFLQHLNAASNPYVLRLAGAPPASSPQAAVALAAAEALEGHPYQWGGTGPIGYDCSGLTGKAYAAAGIRLPRTAAQQYLSGPHVPLADLEPGDLLFWASNPSNPATIEHVAIYAGKGLMVSANHTGDVVRLQPVWWNGYAGATRPTAAVAATVAGPFWTAGQAA
ncbi:MAG TPA: C40 family peptidase [Mycobacteriales bacterium]